MVLSLTDKHVLGQGKIGSMDDAGVGNLGAGGCIGALSV